jgi:hypothetical protein
VLAAARHSAIAKMSVPSASAWHGVHPLGWLAARGVQHGVYLHQASTSTRQGTFSGPSACTRLA